MMWFVESQVIQRHVESTPPDLSLLLGLAVGEGFEFVERTISEWESGENRFDRDGKGFWVATRGAGPAIGKCAITANACTGDRFR